MCKVISVDGVTFCICVSSIYFLFLVSLKIADFVLVARGEPAQPCTDDVLIRWIKIICCMKCILFQFLSNKKLSSIQFICSLRLRNNEGVLFLRTTIKTFPRKKFWRVHVNAKSKAGVVSKCNRVSVKVRTDLINSREPLHTTIPQKGPAIPTKQI